MTIFTVLEPQPQPALEEKIRSTFPNDHLRVNATQWLVSASGSVLELVTKLGIYDPNNPSVPAAGNALVFATSSYHGRGPTATWDWIKNKLEAGNGQP